MLSKNLRNWGGWAAAALAACAGRADTARIPCTADTTLHQIAPDSNLGGHTDVACGSTGHLTAARGLFRFDLAANVPLGAKVTSATLEVTVSFTPGPSPVEAEYQLHRVLVPWGEGTGTGNLGRPALGGESSWNFSANPTAWASPGGKPDVDYTAVASASTPISAAANYTFSSPALAADAQKWVDAPDTDFGWMLICAAENLPQTAKRFGSREGGQPAVLTVEYTTAPTEPRLTISRIAQGVAISWTGGTGPFQLQTADASASFAWTNLGPATTDRSIELPADGTARFFRIMTGAAGN